MKQVTTLPCILPLREYYLALYMGYMWDRYIIFHFLVRNIGCGIDKAIMDV